MLEVLWPIGLRIFSEILLEGQEGAATSSTLEKDSFDVLSLHFFPTGRAYSSMHFEQSNTLGILKIKMQKKQNL